MVDEPTFRILLVEDEPVIRDLVLTLLTAGAVEVELAADGASCLKAARSRPLDLILLDIVLPDLDGISLCRILRSDPATARVPVYMLTARARPSDVETARRAGADGYICKPFKGAELMDLVERLQRERRAG
jgi:DNA-binding response OmpR family regulator